MVNFNYLLFTKHLYYELLDDCKYFLIFGKKIFTSTPNLALLRSGGQTQFKYLSLPLPFETLFKDKTVTQLHASKRTILQKYGGWP